MIKFLKLDFHTSCKKADTPMLIFLISGLTAKRVDSEPLAFGAPGGLGPQGSCSLSLVFNPAPV